MSAPIHFGKLARMRRKESTGKRKPGYVAACLKLGQLDEKTGIVTFTHAAWLQLAKQYRFPRATPRRGVRPAQLQGFTPIKRIGLGDVVGAIATPIARAAKLDCVDKATGQLKPESGCAQRKALLNKLKLPFTKI